MLVTVLFCLSITFAAVVPAFAAVARVKNVKAEVTASKVILSWSKASGVSGYQIQQYSKNTWKSVGTTAKTTYTVTKLTTGTTYKFRVRAYKKSGKKTVYGKASAVVSAKPVCIAPTSFKAAVLSPTSVKFTWKAVPAASGYKLQKYSGKKWVDVSKTTKTYLTLSKLSTGVTVKYRVLAYKTVGKKLVNGKASAVLSVTPNIKVPANVKVTAASPVSANISWSAVPGVTGYLIYKYDSSAKKWVYAAMTGGTRKTVEKLIPTVNNQLRVRAYVKNGDKMIYGPNSNSVSFKTAAIEAPTSLVIKESDSTTATLSWKAVDGVTGYAVYLWNSTANKWDWAVTCSTNSCTVKNLPSNSDFTLAVRAYIKAENSKNYFSANSNSVSGHTSPAAVTNLKAVNLTDKSFTLSWTASKDADVIERYEIRAQITRTNENGDRITSFERIGSVPKETTTFDIEQLDDKALEQKTPYVFRVIGYSFYTKLNSAGKPVTNRLYSTATEAVITTALSNVTDFRAENPTGSSVTVSWSVNTRAESYKLQMKKDGAQEWTDVDLSKCDKVDKSTAVMAYTVKNLEPSTVYFFRVTAISGSITSTATNEISVKTAPKSDAVLEKDTVRPTSITIKWNAMPGAEKYEIQWLQPGKDWEVLGETEKTTLTVNNLSQCTTYKFRMRSYFTSADGSKVYSEGFSNELSETTLLSPISLGYRTDAGMTGSTSISLAWVVNSKATSYKLFYKEGGKDSSSEWKAVEAVITNKDNTTDNVCIYKFTGLKPSTKYSFKGIAECGEVKSNESDVVEGMTAPAKVTGVNASEISDTTAKITWKTVSGADKYVVEIKVGDKWLSSNTGDGAKYLDVYSSGSSGYCKVKNLEQFTDYSFRVTALHDTSSSLFSTKYITSDLSDEVKVQTKLSAVKDFKFVTATENSITVSWTINDKATEYVLKMGSSASSVNTVVTDKQNTKGTTCTVTVTGLTSSNKTVYFTVAAKSGSNIGIENSTTGKTAPKAISNLEVESTALNSAKFKFTCASGADGYIAYLNNETEAPLIGGNTLNGLQSGTEYKVKVKAYNDIGGKRIFSANYSNEVTVLTRLATPAGVKAEIVNGKVVVSWNAVTGATAYNVYRDGEKAETVTTTSFTDDNTEPGQTYTYTVEAVKGEFTSEKSNGATVTTGIADVTGVKAEVESDTKITVSWTAVDGAQYYKVFYDGKSVKATETSCTVSGLTGNTSYKFYVQAFVNESVSSAKVKSNTVKTKITPVDTSSITVSNRTADSVTLTWKKNVYNENYRIYIGNPSTHASFGYIQTNTLYNATIKNLEAGKTYTIYIETYIDSETSDLVPYTITTAAA